MFIVNWELLSAKPFCADRKNKNGGFMKTDKQLQCDVIDELQYDPSVDATKIGVTVQNGIDLIFSMFC